ncbi:MAG: CRTAC1 family protein, partial [Abditibacteriales bacterium]|nr:CRTAC1 family protein [Abditibacteriales bacterium]MDW8367900.1 CRTAC1 family protein [Abditibacteriales bacterium]
YHNEGNGRFRDVSDETGIARHVGKSFGVAVADFNNDGWPDWAVANDTKENFLFINREGRYFEERALEAGIALSLEGAARAGMGIDAADWRNDGQFGLIIGNFSRECLALYQNLGDATFKDCTYSANVGETSLLSLTFGVFFFDYNLDGWQDIFAANGHIDDFIHTKDAKVTYEQLPLLYRGQPDGKFVEVGKESGPALAQKRVLRGCAHGDYDNDGDPDIAVVWNNRRGELWRNEGGNANRWVGLVLQGTRSNRDGIGALVKVTANGMTQTAYRHSGGSFLSESDARLVFGLGAAHQADRVEVRWPSGVTSQFTNVAAGAYYLVVEGQTHLKPWNAPRPVPTQQ